MEPKCVIREKGGDRDGKLTGTFDMPGLAVSYAMAELGLDSSRFVVETVHPPTAPRPHLSLVPAA